MKVAVDEARLLDDAEAGTAARLARLVRLQGHAVHDGGGGLAVDHGVDGGFRVRRARRAGEEARRLVARFLNRRVDEHVAVIQAPLRKRQRLPLQVNQRLHVAVVPHQDVALQFDRVVVGEDRRPGPDTAP